ncbi:UDP-N-acetylmuramate dehydrogenase [Patescibacteria group bacterium]|nr:MAG: UDP-N-acetylmuramate dehydrogenase [Patescibacteria group bacterium]
MDDLTLQLQAVFGEALKEHEPMAKHTNFRIGGPARWFAAVTSEGELTRALDLCDARGIPWFVMGGGSNSLFADEEFPGLVMQMAMRKTDIVGTRVTAEAGVLMVGLARATADAGLAGLEWAISLPGTVGGAVRGNAGCFGGETKDHLASVRLLRGNKFIDVPASDLDMGYRHSALKGSHDIVLSATFELTQGDASALKAAQADILAKRKASQPLYAGSAGCLFKNVELKADADLQRASSLSDIPGAKEMLASRRLSAGWLIDKAGMKGTRVGDAQVSETHGNFIVNLGAARAADVRALAARVKEAVHARFGIDLEEEVQWVGEKADKASGGQGLRRFS